jgi:Spy/CpxP family protein refolding chaperone
MTNSKNHDFLLFNPEKIFLMEPFTQKSGLTSKTTEDKPMKKIFFIALSLMILSLGSSELFARGMGKGMGGGCGEPGMGMGMHKPFMHLEMLQYRLDLTNAQVDKVYKIDREYMDKFYQNRNDADKIKDLRDKHLAEIESILTPEQKKNWNDFKKDRPIRGMRDKKFSDNDCPAFGPIGGMHGQHLGLFQKDLGLNKEQIDKIYKIHRDYMDKFYQSRNDGDKVRELREKQDAEIENVLTAEQKTKWNEFKKNPPRYNRKPGGGSGYHRMWDEE